MTKCSKCKQQTILEQGTRCRECIQKAQNAARSKRRIARNAYESSRRRGLPVEKYYRLLKQQHHLCAICDESGKKLYIDHDHETGKVRGLICARCNWLLGRLHDDLSFISRIAKYLQNQRAVSN